MRLDHLLSKETSDRAKASVSNILRSESVLTRCVIQFRGYRKDVPTKKKTLRGVSSAGRAPALQAGGHRFDPGTLHHLKELTEVSQARGFIEFL